MKSFLVGYFSTKLAFYKVFLTFLKAYVYVHFIFEDIKHRYALYPTHLTQNTPQTTASIKSTL